MPVTSGFSCFPHFTQRLLLTTSTYSFYFIFFYAKRERIFRKRTHGVWKRWVQICFYFLLNYKKKVVILLSYFSMRKSTKSHQRERSPLFENSSRVHESVAQAMRGKCVRQWGKVKVGSIALSAISYYHACEHITRESRADSCTHCLHARYKCKAGVGKFVR